MTRIQDNKGCVVEDGISVGASPGLTLQLQSTSTVSAVWKG